MMAEAKEGIWVTPNSLELLFDIFHTSLLRGHLIAASPSRIPGSGYRPSQISTGAREIDDRPMCQKNFRGAGKRRLLKRLPVRKLAVYRLGCRMAEDFDPCLFLDVAPETKLRFNLITWHATWFLAQGLDLENREGMAGRQYDFVELAMQPLERIDLKDAFDAHRPGDRRVVVALRIGEGNGAGGVVDAVGNQEMLQVGQIEIAFDHQHARIHHESSVAHKHPHWQLRRAHGDAGAEHRNHAHRGAQVKNLVHIVGGSPPGARGYARGDDHHPVSLAAGEILEAIS